MKLKNRVVLIVALLGCRSVWGADDPFVGTWKLDGDKSQLPGFHQEIKDLGNNNYEIVNGNIRATIVADGAEHPTTYGSAESLKIDGPDKWTATINHKLQGQQVQTFTLAGNGKELNLESKGRRPDGSSYIENTTFTRVGSGSGIPGKWEKRIRRIIKPFGADGLSIVTPEQNSRLDVKFGGKDYPDEGPRMPPGSMYSAQRLDAHTIQIAFKRGGKVTGTYELKVSEDGRTLTEVHKPELPRPIVFEKIY